MNGKELQGSELFVDAAKLDRRAGSRRNKAYGPQPEDECWFCGKTGHW